MARITATAGAEWASADAPSTGSELQRGRVLRLQQGGAEIVFASGAHVILEGPAEFTIVNRNSAILIHGKVAAHVPPEARGFQVTAGKMVVTDFGTEFGLSVDPNGEASVDVFSGRVDVSHLIDAGSEVKTTHLVKGQAMSGSASTGTMIPAQADTQKFARDITQVRRAVPLHNTGVGIGPWKPDPNWPIVAESIKPNFTPQNPTMQPVRRKQPYALNTPQSAWVGLESAPDGTYTFETSVDLTGFDPKTLSLTARIMADDGIGDVLVNGKGCGIHFVDVAAKSKFFEFPIQGGFVSGPNKIDFIVINDGGRHGRGVSPMLLRVEWVASARPLPTPDSQK